nr:hypothetical protein [Tanacetum cinerariifolium]
LGQEWGRDGTRFWHQAVEEDKQVKALKGTLPHDIRVRVTVYSNNMQVVLFGRTSSSAGVKHLIPSQPTKNVEPDYTRELWLTLSHNTLVFYQSESHNLSSKFPSNGLERNKHIEADTQPRLWILLYSLAILTTNSLIFHLGIEFRQMYSYMYLRNLRDHQHALGAYFNSYNAFLRNSLGFVVIDVALDTRLSELTRVNSVMTELTQFGLWEANRYLLRLNRYHQTVMAKPLAALGWHLEEIHVTWAHLKKKRTRLRLYTIYLEETVHTKRGDGVTDFKRRRLDFQNDNVMDLATASRRSRYKVAIEDSTWRRRYDYNTTPLRRFSYRYKTNFRVLSV